MSQAASLQPSDRRPVLSFAVVEMVIRAATQPPPVAVALGLNTDRGSLRPALFAAAGALAGLAPRSRHVQANDV